MKAITIIQWAALSLALVAGVLTAALHNRAQKFRRLSGRRDIPWWMGLPAALRRALGFCCIQLRVDLTQSDASTLDNSAILGLGHDRDRLEHAYSLDCIGVHRADCAALPRRNFQGETRVPAFVSERFTALSLFPRAGQDHLFDRHGKAPGIYHFDKESEPAVLAWLDQWLDTPSISAANVSSDGVEDTKPCTQHGQPQRDVAHPTATSHPSAP